MKESYLILLSSLILISCSLEAPPKVGEVCPGVSKINYSKSDECATKTCPEYDEALRRGYCPANYRCVTGEDNTYCVMDCVAGSDMVLCNGKCIDPKSDDDFCGAKGRCENIHANSNDYVGTNCHSLNTSDSRYY